jgi:hypothetical protein
MPFLRLSTCCILCLLVIAAPACNLSSVSGPTSDAEGLAAELSFCRDEVNRYRATIGRPPLTRSQALEDFAARGAETDGLARVAHHHFSITNGGGTATAETEILWWRSTTVRTVIRDGLAQMWQVGPQGDHYRILAGPYSEVGCGVFVNDGEVTVVQDFR